RGFLLPVRPKPCKELSEAAEGGGDGKGSAGRGGERACCAGRGFGGVYLWLVTHSILYLVPKNWLSRAVGRAVEIRWPLGLDRLVRDLMIRAFRPDVAEAERP